MSEFPTHHGQEPQSQPRDMFDGSPHAVAHDIDGQPIPRGTKTPWEIAGEIASFVGEVAGDIVSKRLIPQKGNLFDSKNPQHRTETADSGDLR